MTKALAPVLIECGVGAFLVLVIGAAAFVAIAQPHGRPRWLLRWYERGAQDEAARSREGS